MRGLLGLSLAGSVASCWGAPGLVTPLGHDVQLGSTTAPDSPGHQAEKKLAVIVPAYAGDLSRVIASLARWPTKCSTVTLENADLVLYYAEGPSETTVDAQSTLAGSAGRCFAETRVVYANLGEEVSEFPKSSATYCIWCNSQGMGGHGIGDGIAGVLRPEFLGRLSWCFRCERWFAGRLCNLSAALSRRTWCRRRGISDDHLLCIPSNKHTEEVYDSEVFRGRRDCTVSCLMTFPRRGHIPECFLGTPSI